MTKIQNIRRIQGRAKQKGATILQFLIGTVVGAIALVVAVNAIQGQRFDANLNEGLGFVTGDLSQALSSYYYSNNRTFAGLAVSAAIPAGTAAYTPAATSGTAALITRYNLRTELPWGADYWRISVAGNKGNISVQLSCDSMGGNDADSIVRCNQLAGSINNSNLQMLVPNSCAGPAAAATGAAIAMTCQFRAPV